MITLPESSIETGMAGRKVKTFVYLQNILATNYDRF